MSEKLNVDQLCIRAGTWQQQHPPNIRIIAAGSGPGRRQRPRRSRGDLYIVLDATRHCEISPELCDELATALSDTYYQMTGSVTRGLRAALLAGNTLLFERNLRADGAHQVTAGIGCAVVRDGEVYIGQLGPALASLVHQGEMVRYPADSIWLRSDSPGTFDLNREPPAGLRRDVEPNLFHTNLAPGDVLLLSTTALVRIARQKDLVGAVTHARSGAVRDAIEGLASGRDLSVVIIECPGPRQSRARTVETMATEPSPAVGSVPPARTSPKGAKPFEPVAPEQMGTKPPTEAIPAVPPPGYAESAPQDEGKASLADERLPVAGVRDGDEGMEARDLTPESAYADVGTPGAEDLARHEQEWPRVDLGELRENLSQSAEQVRQRTEDFLLRVLPDKLPERPAGAAGGRVRDDSAQAISLSGRALVLIALIIPLVMFFIVVMTRIQYERIRQEHFSSLQAMAQSRYDTALKMPSRAEMRQRLYDALATSEEGLAINPDDEALNTLRRRIHHKLDEIDVVRRLFHLWKLAELEDDALSPTDSSRIVIHGIDVFLLNRGSSRVYKYLLNEAGDALQSPDSSPILVQKGELRGGIQLGDMVDIAWMEAGGQRTLSTFVVLERPGSLLAYDPQQGIDVLPVADSDIWLKPQAIAGYYGNLYVLDPLLSRILKYMPTDNAYTNPPSDYLDPQLDVDLTGAVDLAIDGNVYVLFADGQVKKFLKGDPQSFALQGLPSPMRSPTTIFVSGPQEAEARGYVYITDTGNERIVQFDKSGNYVRQFKAQSGEKHMENLRGIYVDEEMERMFILSGKTLWLANIPPLTGD